MADFEYDAKDILNVRIDRKRKLPATTFLMALPDEDLNSCLSTTRGAIRQTFQACLVKRFWQLMALLFTQKQRMLKLL